MDAAFLYFGILGVVACVMLMAMVAIAPERGKGRKPKHPRPPLEDGYGYKPMSPQPEIRRPYGHSNTAHLELVGHVMRQIEKSDTKVQHKDSDPHDWSKPFDRGKTTSRPDKKRGGITTDYCT